MQVVWSFVRGKSGSAERDGPVDWLSQCRVQSAPGPGLSVERAKYIAFAAPTRSEQGSQGWEGFCSHHPDRWVDTVIHGLCLDTTTTSQVLELNARLICRRAPPVRPAAARCFASLMPDGRCVEFARLADRPASGLASFPAGSDIVSIACSRGCVDQSVLADGSNARHPPRPTASVLDHDQHEHDQVAASYNNLLSRPSPCILMPHSLLAATTSP